MNITHEESVEEDIHCCVHWVFSEFSSVNSRNDEAENLIKQNWYLGCDDKMNHLPVSVVIFTHHLPDGVDCLQLKELDHVVGQGEDDDGDDVANTIVHTSLQYILHYKVI